MLRHKNVLTFGLYQGTALSRAEAQRQTLAALAAAGAKALMLKRDVFRADGQDDR